MAVPIQAWRRRVYLIQVNSAGASPPSMAGMVGFVGFVRPGMVPFFPFSLDAPLSSMFEFLFRLLQRSAARASATAAPAPCFHCGLPLPAKVCDRVEFDGVARSVCCAACAAVAQAVIAAGYGDYYTERLRLAEDTNA